MPIQLDEISHIQRGNGEALHPHKENGVFGTSFPIKDFIVMTFPKVGIVR